jgi:hypothetical protein
MHADEQFVSSAADDARLSYLEWCSMNGVKPHLCSVPLNVTTTQLREIVQSLIAPADVDALVCAPQGFAGRSLSILEESLGVHVGASFGLASLAGDPTTEIGNPHITVATLSAWNFGSQAVRLLAAAIGGNQTDREHRFDDFVIQKALID